MIGNDDERFVVDKDSTINTDEAAATGPFISFSTMNDLYNKKNACMFKLLQKKFPNKKGMWKHGTNSRYYTPVLYINKTNKYILVINPHWSVYSISNDEWTLTKYEEDKDFIRDRPTFLINDELMIFIGCKEIQIFHLTNNFVTREVIGKYKTCQYSKFAAQLVKYEKIIVDTPDNNDIINDEPPKKRQRLMNSNTNIKNDCNDKSITASHYFVSFVAFGGTQNEPFHKSFCQIDIKVSIDYTKVLKLEEKQIMLEDTSKLHFVKQISLQHGRHNFSSIALTMSEKNIHSIINNDNGKPIDGTECLLNHRIIFIVGGLHTEERSLVPTVSSVLLYNYHEKEIFEFEQV